MKKFIWLLIMLHTATVVCGQTKEVSGTILSVSNQPVAGAIVKAKQSNQQTSSNEKGMFRIKAAITDILVVSYVGYETVRVVISSQSRLPLTIMLNNKVNQLSEVVVSTGYQTVPKERATGSFSQIGNERFNEQVGTDVLSRLEAIGNSVSVSRKTAGNESQLMVRGLSTIQGVKQPLIILDNFPYEGDLGNINPNDIQTITLLKDAAAASVWGTKAGNGVIVITTKGATFNQTAKIDVASNLTVAEKPNLFYLPQMATSDFIDVERFLFDNKFRFSDTSSTSRPSFSEVYEILFKQKNNQLSQAEANSQINKLRSLDVRKDFERYFYRHPINQQYSLNINGGNNNMAWLLFGGYDKGINELDAVSERINVRSQNTFRPFKNLQVVLSGTYTQTKNVQGKPSFSQLSTSKGRIAPYTRLADENGNQVAMIRDYRKSYTDTVGGGKLLDWNYYPLSDYAHISNTVQTTDILANIGLLYRLTDWLSADVKYQYEKQQTIGENLQGIESYGTRDLINRFTKIDKVFNTVANIVPKGDILDYFTRNLIVQNLRGQLNFAKTISDIDFNAIIGGETSQKRAEQNKNRAYGYNDDILTTVGVDYANPYQNFIQGTYSFIPNLLSFQSTLNRFVSTYGNLALAYKSKYLFSVSARRDASNLFGVNANNRWTPLWSTGIGWEISKENFYKSRYFPYLKLRLTYGFSGNVNPDATAVSTIAYNATSPYTQTPMAIIDKFYNPELRWEKVGMLNAGIDFRTLNNGVNGSIEYYRKKATDLFGSVPIDYTVGLVQPTIVKNVASMVGNGLDLELNTVNINRQIKWMTNLNASYYRDKVTDYYLDSYLGSNFINGGQLIAGIVGKPVYAVFAYKWAGLDGATGDPLGYLDGQMSKDYLTITGSGTTINDLKYFGPAFPVFFGSMGNTISFKNLSLTARVSYRLGYYFQKQSINYSLLVDNSIGHIDFARRWQNVGDEKFTDVPSFVYPVNAARDNLYNGSEILVDRADNIRLQYVNISYDFNGKKLRDKISKLQAFVVFNNLGILWKASRTSVDPDYNYSVIPPSKTMSLGIKASF